MNILTSYFNTQLINAGFPDDLEINWSLGHCQGDGMAFYGKITHICWLGLFQRIYPNQKRKFRKFERLASSPLHAIILVIAIHIAIPWLWTHLVRQISVSLIMNVPKRNGISQRTRWENIRHYGMSLLLT